MEPILDDAGAEEAVARALSFSQQQPSPAVLPDRITVTGSVYHQSSEGEPTQVPLTFERLLETKEQVFQRRLIVGEEWQPLIPERCWLQGNQVGMIVVRNDEGRHANVQLSQEQKDSLKDKVLEVMPNITMDVLRSNLILVYPRESQPLTFAYPQDARIRSRAGKTRCTVYVFPR